MAPALHRVLPRHVFNHHPPTCATFLAILRGDHVGGVDGAG